MKRLAIIFLFAVVYLFVAGIARATDFSSSNFIVRDPVLSGGGGFATSSSFQLWSAFSQPAIGTSTATNFELQGGFFYFSSTTAASTAPPPPPPPPPDPGGGGPISPPVAPPPPGTPPPFFGSLISLLTGEPAPILCPDGKRSDLNCDGEVNLKDLSILFAQPKLVTGKILSLLFSDWTQNLPVPLYGPESSPGSIAEGGLSNPPAGLAQVSSAFPTTTVATGTAPSATRASFFQALVRFIKAIFRFVLRVFGL